MNTTSLKPALLFRGDIFWLAWNETGDAVFAMDVKTEYLIIQGMLEHHGYYDIAENSKLADKIRASVDNRQHNW